MSPNEFFRQLSGASPGVAPVPPLTIKIGTADIMAAKLLLWLQNEMSEDATTGDLEDVLDAAKWWSVFFASANTAAQYNKSLQGTLDSAALDGWGGSLS